MALNQTFNQDASGNEFVTGPLTDTQLRATGVPVTGPLTDTQLRATAVPVSGPATDAQMRATPIPISGTVSTSAVTSATATLTSVAGSVTSVSILALNASRKGIALFNDSTAIAYVAYGATASTTAFTVKMQPGSFYENSVLYTGAVSAIFSSATGSMRVTELT